MNRRLAYLPLMALLYGCQVIAPVQSELSDTGIQVPSKWTSAKTTAPLRPVWLKDFGDPVLWALVDEAVASNYDLLAVVARVKAARAQAAITGSNAKLQLDSSAAASRRGIPSSNAKRQTSDTFEGQLDAAWEADLWDRLADATRAAEREAAAAAQDYEAARLSLAADVGQAWFDAVESELQVELAAETARNFRQNLAIVEEGFRSGLNDALDVRLERANLAEAESQLELRRIQRNQTVRTLEVLLGRYPGAQLAVASRLPRLMHEVPVGLPAELLERRPDVRAAATRLAAADARLNEARKNRLPSIRLTASGGVSSGELRNLLDFDSVLWTLAAGLAAPIFQGGRLSAEVDLARARADEALVSYAQALLTAFREVETALAAEGLLARRESALRVAAEESSEAATLALERYRSGLVDIITWLEARRRAFSAKSSLLEVNNQRLQNRIALHLALGGDFAPPASRQGLGQLSEGRHGAGSAPN